MDEQPVIEFHPHGTITINFDDGPIRLRRCRLGDLEYAKNSYDELLPAFNEATRQLQEESQRIADEKPDDALIQLRNVERRMGRLAMELVVNWTSGVIGRMGDGKPPPVDEWPLALATLDTVRGMIEHWQTRPLASGSRQNNGAAGDVPNLSGLSPLEVSSPPAPPSPSPSTAT